MEIKVYGVGKCWSFAIIAANGVVVAESCRLYANRRNALAAAKLIAKSKIEVVEA